jgi:hypothetical protein
MTEQLALIDPTAVPAARRSPRRSRLLATADQASPMTSAVPARATASLGGEPQPRRVQDSLAPIPLRDLNYRFRLSAQTRQVGLEGIKQARAALAEWHHHQAA